MNHICLILSSKRDRKAGREVSMTQEIQAASHCQEWKQLKNDLIKTRFPDFRRQFKSLSFYDLIELMVDDKGAPKLMQANEKESPSYLAYTRPELLSRSLRARPFQDIQSKPSLAELGPQSKLKTFMLGDLIGSLNSSSRPMSLKLNPILVEDGMLQRYVAEEIIIIPLFDQVTQKYLICDPEDALALLAISPEDQNRLGMELVFYSITNKFLPEEKGQREKLLKEKIDELAFLCSRVPMRKGSGTFICVLLNLENSMEEAAFIRHYKTFDSHTDLIFVTSELEIITGELERIHYDGNSIDTIFMPLIRWQRAQHLDS
jgi:hypothetical protein